METVRIRDPGWKKDGSGIRDKHPGSATLPISTVKPVADLMLPVFNKIYYIPTHNKGQKFD
jgi:hypothetical protein